MKSQSISQFQTGGRDDASSHGSGDSPESTDSEENSPRAGSLRLIPNVVEIQPHLATNLQEEEELEEIEEPIGFEGVPSMESTEDHLHQFYVEDH